MKIIEKFVDVNTQEETVIERTLVGAELELYKNAEAQAIAQIELAVETQAKRDAALAKLEALGLTADDLKALGL